MKAIRLAAAAVVGLALAGTAGTTSAASSDWAWRGPVAAGRTVDVRGLNGAIHAVRAAGRDLVVTAVKSARRGDPDAVRIEHYESGGTSFFCAIHPGMTAGSPNPCETRGSSGRDSGKDEDEVEVEWRLEVPPGVRLIARTVNGDVAMRGLEGPIEVWTVNGSIDVGTDDVAEARTVNGDITARLGSGRLPHDLEFSTVNGSVRLALHPDVGAEVRASCLNGELASDFPLEVAGKRRWSQKRMHGTLGGGGALLSLSTVNGSIELARQSSASK